MRRGEGVRGTVDDPPGKRVERAPRAEVTESLPQGGDDERGDLVAGAGGAALPQGPARGEPRQVLAQCVDGLVDARALQRGGPHHRATPTARDGTLPHLDHVAQVPHRRIGAVAVGLVDDEDVPDLEDPRLRGLDPVAHAGREQHERRVRRPGDLDLGLTDADGLDEDRPEARRVEHPDGLRSRDREPAEVTAAGERADVDPRVAGRVVHPDAVAEQRTSGEGRRGVDGDDGDLFPLRPQGTHERVGGRRLADAGGAGDADDVGAARVGSERRHDLGQGRVLVVDERDESPDGTRRPRPGLLDQDGDIDAAAQAQALGTRMIRASP